MFHNRNWLGVGLITLFVLGLGLPAAFAQVFVLLREEASVGRYGGRDGP